MSGVVFPKRKSRKRARARVEEGEEEEEEVVVNRSGRSGASRGLVTSTLGGNGDGAIGSKVKRTEGETKGGIISRSAASGFEEGTSGGAAGPGDLVGSRMEAYVEEQVRKELGEVPVSLKVSGAEPMMRGKELDKEDERSGGGDGGIIPSFVQDLINEARGGRGAASRKLATEGDVGQGGLLAYNTGIARVVLPTEERLRAIEATEKARQEYEAKEKLAKLPTVEIGSSSYNSNYAQQTKKSSKSKHNPQLLQELRQRLDEYRARQDHEAADEIEAEIAEIAASMKQ